MLSNVPLARCATGPWTQTRCVTYITQFHLTVSGLRSRARRAWDKHLDTWQTAQFPSVWRCRSMSKYVEVCSFEDRMDRYGQGTLRISPEDVRKQTTVLRQIVNAISIVNEKQSCFLFLVSLYFLLFPYVSLHRELNLPNHQIRGEIWSLSRVAKSGYSLGQDEVSEDSGLRDSRGWGGPIHRGWKRWQKLRRIEKKPMKNWEDMKAFDAFDFFFFCFFFFFFLCFFFFASSSSTQHFCFMSNRFPVSCLQFSHHFIDKLRRPAMPQWGWRTQKYVYPIIWTYYLHAARQKRYLTKKRFNVPAATHTDKQAAQLQW